jgi:hypothetical protein
VIVQTFIDDSGSDWQSAHFVLSGFCSDAHSWEGFSDAWAHILEDVPKIGYFKAREAQSLKGEFLGWDEAARDAKISTLVDLICKFPCGKIDIIMHQSHYDKHVKGCIPKEIDSPYFPSVVTSKAASCGHFKTGQLDGIPGQDSYTLTTGVSAIFFP